MGDLLHGVDTVLKQIFLIVQHEPIHDLEGPGVKPVLITPEWSVEVDDVVGPEVNVDGGYSIVLWSVRLEKISYFLQAQGMKAMRGNDVECGVVQSLILE